MRWMRMLLAATLLAGLVLSLGCGPSAPPEAESPEEKEEPAPTAKAEEPPPEPKKPDPVETAKIEPPKPEPKPKVAEKPKPKPKPKPVGPPVVVMETSKGVIKIELDPKNAPNTVKNFLAYVDDKFFDGTIFHRVKPKFMIQGGGFTPDMKEKPNRAPIKNESANGLPNLRGTIAMARTGNPHSATSQFYINHITNDSLDRKNAADGWGYCVFGKVIEGMDVVDAIAVVPTGVKRGHGDVPLETVLIKSIRRDG